jgi:hypothetical protein
VLLEPGLELIALPDAPLDRQVAVDDFAHPLLDLREILGGERLFPREIVVEAVLDRRAEGDLGAGEQLLHRLREHMRGVVPDQLQRVRVLGGDDRHLGVLGDRQGQILHLAVDFHRERGLGETGPDAGGKLGARDGLLEGADAAVREGDVDHGRVAFGLGIVPLFFRRPGHKRQGPVRLRPGPWGSSRRRKLSARAYPSARRSGSSWSSSWWRSGKSWRFRSLGGSRLSMRQRRSKRGA